MPRTLWEKFNERVKGPAENEVYNPAGFKVNGRVVIDRLDYRDHNWVVEQLVSYTYRSGGVDLRHTDYVLKEQLAGGRTIRLRAIPRAKGRPQEPTYSLVLLQLYHEQAFDAGLEGHLQNTDNTGIFECFNDGRLEATYHRIGGAKGPYDCKTEAVRDEDGNGRCERDEIVRGQAQYYDFWRDTQDEGGTPVQEYLFAEIRGGKGRNREEGDGWMSIHTGVVLDLERIVEM